jgi:hypothetical protein
MLLKTQLCKPEEKFIMRATILYRAGDVRVATVPDAKIEKPSDTLVRIMRACI